MDIRGFMKEARLTNEQKDKVTKAIVKKFNIKFTQLGCIRINSGGYLFRREYEDKTLISWDDFVKQELGDSPQLSWNTLSQKVWRNKREEIY
jgi:hypothetical protein